MKDIKDFLGALKKVLQKDPRYKLEAYTFLMAALDYTVSKLPKHRHVTGQELLEGVKEYGLEQFGPMARTVFEHWGVTSTEDFGNIVFNLIDVALLGKTEEDSIDDFKGVYDFKEAFDKDYRYKLDE